jgi:nitroimidazol reductase NimA-like FMN-containing flavoprotein (pyridoxamine 5'-phosphate oxidase superfamily)
MSRRDAIRMTPKERRAFTSQQRVLTCASVGPGGRPHLMPLWFVSDGEDLLAWTYARSQKTRNLERVAQATVQLEAGATYEELRGVMHECDVELIRDPEQVAAIGLAVAVRYAPGDLRPESAPPELRAFVDRQAPKRVGLRFIPTRTVSWDHRKLSGTY